MPAWFAFLTIILISFINFKFNWCFHDRGPFHGGIQYACIVHIIKILFTIQTKRFELAGHYSNIKYWNQYAWLCLRGSSFHVNSQDIEECNETKFRHSSISF